MLWPGDLVVRWRSFNRKAVGQMIGNLIGNDVAIVHIDRLLALFLSDKGMRSASLEEEGGEQDALGGGGAE